MRSDDVVDDEVRLPIHFWVKNPQFRSYRYKTGVVY